MMPTDSPRFAIALSLERIGQGLRSLDARLFQIAFLGALLVIGVLLRDFSLRPEQMLLCFAAGVTTQIFWVRRLHLKNVGIMSALITCLGLSILLRADTLWVHPLVAALAISSKFVLRIRGKHVFNPANGGVILALSVLPGAWISPGQWGNDLAYALREQADPHNDADPIRAPRGRV